MSEVRNKFFESDLGSKLFRQLKKDRADGAEGTYVVSGQIVFEEWLANKLARDAAYREDLCHELGRAGYDGAPSKMRVKELAEYIGRQGFSHLSNVDEPWS